MSELPNNNPISELLSSLKNYLDLRLDDIKLSSAEHLSRIISRLLYLLTLIFVLCLAFGFLCVCFSRWISNVTGSDLIGPACAFGLLSISALVLFLNRNRIFVNQNLRVFIEMFFGKNDEDNKKSR